ncbi:hypothetical protein [Mesoplasma lactucae]|uniref:Uncharacterized protein n=1 Tax=Mesoplasma lactucae ATCC 49193 TaxID=81460 RepID=A0A291IS75_9MOLU|nr:hypothetical protein [Mesoplasma lactucae]ATG97610.1 hypothetical protein CP520_02605 [Mesoplasma lactucae ATCC 49193]ATZ19929.1 aspartyl/glutamyl-tRNA amidotransferase subunit C [Mesoplasma lactucae ATCC 49193]MCL8216793.1 Aspartyl/glutamyl-tRNA(Asn/Gln) amidotransferase subunit C [Mesoplasma lactucae ATCC 49193]
MTNIQDILKSNKWDVITVSLKDGNEVIHQSFTTEYAFEQFVKNNLSKYEVSKEEHSLIFNKKTGKTTLNFDFVFDSKKKMLSDEYIQKLADDIMINLSQGDIDDIQQTEQSIREKFLKVLTINTDGVEAKYYPFDMAHTYLREDDDFHTLDHDKVLENAPTIDGDYVTIVKVVK